MSDGTEDQSTGSPLLQEARARLRAPTQTQPAQQGVAGDWATGGFGARSVRLGANAAGDIVARSPSEPSALTTASDMGNLLSSPTAGEVAGRARHGRLVLAELGEPALLRGGAEELREVRVRLRHLRHLR